MASENGAEAVLPLPELLALDSAERIGKLSPEGSIPAVSPFQEITAAGGVSASASSMPCSEVSTATSMIVSLAEELMMMA